MNEEMVQDFGSLVDIDSVGQLLITSSKSILLAIVTLTVGLWIINKLVRAISILMEKKEIDATLRPFLKNITSIGLRVMLFITVAGVLGVEMTSFIAVLGAAGLAVGLALQGSLSNFAGGVIILVLKPIKVGEFIETLGFSGTVKEILIFNTILNTTDNKMIVLPNGSIANSPITNFSRLGKRRLEIVFGVSYGTKIETVKDAVLEIVKNDTRIHPEPEPFFRLSEMADSSVNYTLRVWVDAAEFWPLNFDLKEKVYTAFNEKGIGIPFPQMDVHLHKVN